MSEFKDLGKWCSFADATRSKNHPGIPNQPSAAQYANMKLVYENIYAPVCEHFGHKIPVSSFFRSVKLNVAVGGSDTSDHLNGRAVDLDCDLDPALAVTNDDVFLFMRDKLSCDQLILENPNKNNVPGWVHGSYRNAATNRNMILKMIRVNGKPQYERLERPADTAKK